MTSDDYKILFWQKDLPTDLELWQKIAKGLVGALKDKDVDYYYVNQAEHFKATLALFPTASALDVYAEVVLKANAQVYGWRDAEATPENVKEVCCLYASTVGSFRPSAKLEELRAKIRSLREDLEDAQGDLVSLEDDLDGIKDDIDETREELEGFIKKFQTVKGSDVD